MWLLELAAAVYLTSVLWPHAKRLRSTVQFRAPTVRGVIIVCAYAWIVLWVVHIIALSWTYP